MLSLTQLRDRMAPRFPDTEQVEESVIRFTRRLGDCPFAVYYVDISYNPPSTPEALTDYQDRVIGKRYFDGRKSLQWSNYLFFIVADEHSTTSAVRKARELIEQDRTYARKFVITENELDSAVRPPAPTTSDSFFESNILTKWTARLTEAGLDRAVFTDATLPKRLQLIEKLPTSSRPSASDPPAMPTNVKAPFLQSVRLTRFRDFPAGRFFEFGRVNLIFGVNGSGKTSLLEAIELAYCGRNKRNPDANAPYTIAVRFADGSSETATDERRKKRFRDRNLAWYGQAEVKTNYLFQSFARFNFLDTDAAVSIADSTDRLQEDLSKLLVGPQASKTWREIQRTDEAVVAKIRELQPLRNQMKDELASIDARLKETLAVKQESDSIFKRLEEVTGRAGWSLPTGDKETVAGDLVEVLSELASLARQATAFECASSPVSIDALKESSDTAKRLCEKNQPEIVRLERLRERERRLTEDSRGCREALRLVDKAKQCIDAGLPARVVELRKQQGTLATTGGALAGYEDSVLPVLSKCREGISVEDFVRETESERAAAERFLSVAREEHAKFTDVRANSLKLAQELREIATQLLANSSNADQCPLCHTQFDAGELAKHMQLGVDEHVETRAKAHLTRIRQREAIVRATMAAESAAGWLAQFCNRTDIALGESAQFALSRVISTRQALEDAQRRSKALKKELQSLESRGLLVAKLDELSDALSDAGYPLAEWTEQNVTQLRDAVKKELAQASKALEEKRKTADDLHRGIEESLALSHTEIGDLKSAVAQLEEKRALADSLRTKLKDMLKTLPWRSDKSLSELVVEADSSREIASAFRSARAKEGQARAIFAEVSRRKEELEKDLAILEPRLERFREAHTALESIQDENSLKGAMQTALNRNRSTIEAIFCRIHTPAEFSGLGEQLANLIRKTDGREASLSEISTGQRSAFALSVFLAQNAQLRTAPPVVLIDDPIAHVDDLNSLSFLDYLREIALVGERQIIFTTANEKLATLFERKFDFLGDQDFRRFDLLR